MDKHFDHIKSEQEIRKLWEENKIYEFKTDSNKEIFSIDTPPPTVSGSLHIGHLFSYTHPDIIARYKRLKGFNIYYPMGFDDNGLATERFVEKIHGIKANQLKRSDFIKLCLEQTAKTEKDFEDLWRKMGLSIDWTTLFSTISDKVRKISQYSFIQLFKKNLVYRKEEPSLYCTTCQTTVAQAELDNLEISSTFNDIEFETEAGEKLIIATTRPELLPACVAIFFHPEDSRYKKLENSYAIVPIFKQKVKIIADEKVQKDKGSGLVMCCTFGDQTDIFWYKKHKLSFIQIIGRDGRWTNISKELSGLKVHEARKKVLELLQQSGKLINQKRITHAVNVHERCKQEIEYLILSQWFIKILENKNIFLDLANKIEWKPAFMQARYKDWVENLNWDWCISRQRFYGIPFPVWHCQNCKNIIIADEKDLPIDPQEQEYPNKKCTKCNSNNITPETDIMDTWNTSSLTPQIHTKWPEETGPIKIPMSMRPQAHDIIRTWAFYTIIKAYYHHNSIPWKEIVISGHVLSGKEKISKSKENSNALNPTILLEKNSADAIRYWSANGKLGTDTAFSENQLKIGQRLVTKLWNAAKFCSEHIQNYTKQNTPADLDNLNKWILHKFTQTTKTFHQYFEKYDYTLALETAEKFFWQNFCDNYLELIKDQLFNPDKYSLKEINNTKFTLYEIFFGTLQLFAPIIPYITEELYQNLFKQQENKISIHTTEYIESRFNYNFETEAEFMDKLIEIISIARKLKSENQLSLKTEIEELNIYSKNNKLLEQLKAEENLLKGITKSKNIKYLPDQTEPTKLEKKENIFCMNINAN